MDKNNIGDFIKRQRKAKNINSIELSNSVGKSDAYISQIENGRNKNPDYNTLYNIFRKMDIDEEKIEGYLNRFGFKSPQQLAKEEAEAEEHWIQRQEELANDPDYQQHQLERAIEQQEQERLEFLNQQKANETVDWLMEIDIKLNKMNDEVKNELAFFINKNLDVFEGVIKNLHALVTSMKKEKDNYDFFTTLFKRDLTKLNKESMDAIIDTVKAEFIKAHKYNGGWGEPPSF